MRPITTLFLLCSVDGKISTGSADILDFDRDLPFINGVKEGLQQYYDIEATTDIWSLCSGRTKAKIGYNRMKELPDKTDVNHVIIDNDHLDYWGVKNLCAEANRLIVVTTNKEHPAFSIKAENLSTLIQSELDLKLVLESLHKYYECDRLTIQSGGTLNKKFLSADLVDFVDIVIAPVIIGGKDTPTLVDGDSLTEISQLKELKALKLIDMQRLEESYVRLRYEVIR